MLILAGGLGVTYSAFSQVETAFGADAVPQSIQPPGFRTNRAEFRNDYQHLQDGSTVYMIVPRLDFSADPDLSFRIEAPMAFTESASNETASGLGDLLFRGSFRVSRGAGYAIVAGSELILNTATKDALGTGKNVIAPLIFASIDLPRYNSVVFPFLQHFVTLGGGDSRPDVHYTSFKSAFLTRWSNLVYTIIEPRIIIDHERSDKVGSTLETEVGRFLNRDTAIWVRPGVGLFGDNLPQVYDWKLEIGVRFFLN